MDTDLLIDAHSFLRNPRVPNPRGELALTEIRRGNVRITPAQFREFVRSEKLNLGDRALFLRQEGIGMIRGLEGRRLVASHLDAFRDTLSSFPPTRRMDATLAAYSEVTGWRVLTGDMDLARDLGPKADLFRSSEVRARLGNLRNRSLVAGLPEDGRWGRSGVRLATGLAVAGAALTAWSSFQTVRDSLGNAAQTMNPPRPDTTISFPEMGLRSGRTFGERLHNRWTWTLDLFRRGESPVEFRTTRVSPFGETRFDGHSRISRQGFSRETEILRTPAGPWERSMLRDFPLGSYFDPLRTTGSRHFEFHQTIRIQTGPFSNPGFGYGVGGPVGFSAFQTPLAGYDPYKPQFSQ